MGCFRLQQNLFAYRRIDVSLAASHGANGRQQDLRLGVLANISDRACTQHAHHPGFVDGSS